MTKKEKSSFLKLLDYIDIKPNKYLRYPFS